MIEHRTRRIELPDFNVSELRFTLRLCYTGHMDAADWEDTYDKPHPEDAVSDGDSPSCDIVDSEGRPTCPPAAQTPVAAVPRSGPGMSAHAVTAAHSLAVSYGNHVTG